MLPGAQGCRSAENGSRGILNANQAAPAVPWKKGTFIPFSQVRRVAPKWGYLIPEQPLSRHRIKSLHVGWWTRHRGSGSSEAELHQSHLPPALLHPQHTTFLPSPCPPTLEHLLLTSPHAPTYLSATCWSVQPLSSRAP